jgi:hypothetical protein
LNEKSSTGSAFIRVSSLPQLEGAFFLKPPANDHTEPKSFLSAAIETIRIFLSYSNLLNQGISTGLKNPYLVSPKTNDLHSFLMVCFDLFPGHHGVIPDTIPTALLTLTVHDNGLDLSSLFVFRNSMRCSDGSN